MKRLVLILTLVACVGAGWWWWSRPTPAIAVTMASVKRGPVVSSITLTGELVNDRQVTITALLDGQIDLVAAREGDTVSKEQTLAEQSHEAAQALFDKATEELALARVEADDANRKLDRAERLQRDGDLAEQAYDDARLEAARASARATIAETSVTTSALAVRDATIRAPFDGVVVAQSTETGQWVEAGTPLFTLVATAGQVVEAYVDASDISRVEVGQVATLISDAWSDEPWQSEVSWIAPAIASSERSRSSSVPPNAVAIRLALGDAAPPVRLGQQIEVELVIEQREATLSLPLTALRERAAGQFEVLIVNAGKLRVVEIDTGLMTRDRAEILGGVEEGQSVVGTDVTQLQPGSPVQVR